MQLLSLAILSDVHYASVAEQARGPDYELGRITNPLSRLLIRVLRRYVWLRDPLAKNHLLDSFLSLTGTADYAIANGDYSCDTAFAGVSDDASLESVHECLGKLRGQFRERFRATIGDHELGKFSLAGGLGGMRLESYKRCRNALGLEPVWQVDLGRYTLIGVASSLIALPVLELETLPEEREEWRRLREEHMAGIRECFSNLRTGQRVLLFCHDPTALPFLWREEAVRHRIGQVEQTIIGHLHSDLVHWKSRMLAGFPRVNCFGPAARRMSAGLNGARCWKHFNVRLCPSLAGIELLKDGGFLMATLDPDAERPTAFHLHRLGR
jgi:hypothetical protein